MFPEILKKCSEYLPKISKYPEKLSKDLAIIVMIIIIVTQKEQMFQLLWSNFSELRHVTGHNITRHFNITTSLLLRFHHSVCTGCHKPRGMQIFLLETAEIE